MFSHLSSRGDLRFSTSMLYLTNFSTRVKFFFEAGKLFEPSFKIATFLIHAKIKDSSIHSKDSAIDYSEALKTHSIYHTITYHISNLDE